jgi:orotate phosphoribosyltransferase
VLDPGKRVVLVEDLTTDGKSKINFCAALKRAGAAVDHAVVVFYYGVYPDAEANLAEAGIVLHALTDWKTTLDVAEARGYFTPDQVKVVRDFLADPPRWSREHGGV